MFFAPARGGGEAEESMLREGKEFRLHPSIDPSGLLEEKTFVNFFLCLSIKKRLMFNVHYQR